MGGFRRGGEMVRGQGLIAGCRKRMAAAAAAPSPDQQRTPRAAFESGSAMMLQRFLNALPDPGFLNGRVFAGMDLFFVFDLAHVDDVGQELVQARLGERPAAPFAAVPRRPPLGPPATPV